MTGEVKEGEEEDEAALHDLIDAKLTGLQQWEAHQLTAPHEGDDDIEGEEEREGEEEGDLLFPSASPIYGLMERSFCFCPMPCEADVQCGSSHGRASCCTTCTGAPGVSASSRRRRRCRTWPPHWSKRTPPWPLSLTR